jgi:hypothetical protein
MQLKPVQTIFAVLVALTLFSVSGLSEKTYASSIPEVQPIKSCAVMDVQLHGSNSPTVTCGRWKNAILPKGVNPGTVVVNCGYSYNTDVNGDQRYCFGGTGYIGIHVTHIEHMFSLYNSWVQLYQSGSTNGFRFGIFASESITEPDYPTDGNHDITQLCINCSF